MDEIEVLIKIPKEDYEFIYDEFADGDMPDGKSLTRTTLYAIAKGTVLSKGHGRLIDADAILEDPFGNTYKDIDIAETIIEADKGV